MTITEVANALGLSVSTVSRALTGKGRISEETKRKVAAFVRECELKEQEGKSPAMTGNLGVILPADIYSSNEPYFQECILGICEAAAVLDYNVLIATATGSDITGIRALVEKKKADGIILMRSMEDDKAVRYLEKQSLPIGLTGGCTNEKIIQVDTDNEAASEALTSFLIGSGYRKFALIMENMEYIVNKKRYRGFCKALEKHGIDREKQVFYTNFPGIDVIDSIISAVMVEKVECIVCGDDVICTRMMSNLQAGGYRIPRDIAVASLYNSSNLDCFTPPVTAVSVSARRVGNIVCREMIHCLTGKEYQLRTKVDYEILVRKSTNGYHKEK